MTGAQIFQIAFLVVYLVVLLILGKISTGQVKSNTDFLLSGRQMSWLIVAGGLVGTNFSGAVITSVSNFAYTYGIGGMIYEGSTVIGFLLCAFLYAKRVRLSGAFTIAELFEIRYGLNVRVIAGFFITLSGISAASSQFKAIGLIFNSMFGVPENIGIIIAWVVTVAYMTMGGLASSNYTIIPQMACCFVAFPGCAARPACYLLHPLWAHPEVSSDLDPPMDVGKRVGFPVVLPAHFCCTECQARQKGLCYDLYCPDFDVLDPRHYYWHVCPVGLPRSGQC